MIDRRQVLIRGGGALAALNLGIAARCAHAAGVARAPALFLVDTACVGNGAVVEAARRANIPLVFYAGDFGTAWLEHLEPVWRQGTAPIAGLTSPGSFFCAEHLAHERGLSCSFKSSRAGDAPVLWALAPRGSDIMQWTRS